MEENLKILITCSGLGSRLGEITNFTNKSLARVGKKPAISYIIDSYPINSSFVITTGHYEDHVRQYLKIAHPNVTIKLVNVDKFEGKGSSLAYSMLIAKEYLQKSFIFHACDTLASYEKNSFDTNIVFVADKCNETGNYRTIISSGTSLSLIQEKGISATSDVYIGKCFIKEYKEFWEELSKIYCDKGEYDNTLSDCHAINNMLLNGNKFSIQKVKTWFDIGNIDSLNRARRILSEDMNILDKPDESIYFINDNVIKFFHNSEIVNSRIKRTTFLNQTTPEIVSHSDNFFAYKKHEGEILSRHPEFNNILMEKLLSWTNNNLWSKKSDINISNLCYDFYITKTKNRIKNYLDTRNICDKEYSINGELIPPILDLLDIATDTLIKNSHPSLFHGDFILENILIDSNKKFVLLDWRQDFAGSHEIGDAYYDISKLNHNLTINHDIINDGHYKFEINEKENIFVDIHCSKKLLDAQEVLKNFCDIQKFNFKKVEIITPLIWINMSPLHDKKFGDFLYNFGKINLWRALNK